MSWAELLGHCVVFKARHTALRSFLVRGSRGGTGAAGAERVAAIFSVSSTSGSRIFEGPAFRESPGTIYVGGSDPGSRDGSCGLF